MTLPQIFSALSGAVICTASLYVFATRRTRRFKALFWLAIGCAMVYAAFRPHSIEVLGEDTLALRLRWVVALLSFIVITVTLETIRTARMQERYAFLWLLTGVILFAGTLSNAPAELVTKLTGISYGAMVMVVLFAFVMFMLFHVSMTLSRTRHMLAQIARQCALTEERMRRWRGEPGPGRKEAANSPKDCERDE